MIGLSDETNTALHEMKFSTGFDNFQVKPTEKHHIGIGNVFRSTNES
jgi:hypothetical protein